MNAIKKINAIKGTLSELGGEFVSFIDDKNVIIKNYIDNSIWQISFNESDNGFVFDGTSAKKLQAGKKPIDPIKQHTEKLRKGISALFTDASYDETIGNLKSVIRSLPYIEETDVKIAKEGEKCSEKLADGKPCQGTINATTNKCSNPNCPSNSKNQPVIKKNEVNAVDQGNQKMEEMFSEYSAATFLFKESGEINKLTAIASISPLDRMDLVTETDNILRKMKLYADIKKVFSETVSEKTADAIMKALDWSESLDTGLAKALTIVKTRDDSINILDAHKAFKDAVVKVYGEEADMSKAACWTYNLTTPNAKDDDKKAPFLKFRTGAYTYEALKIMSQELDRALGSINLIPEDLDFLGNYRMIIEYMLQSKQINDHVLTAMVEEFNKRFVKSDDDYQNSPLGWRNRNEQFQGWIKGFATQVTNNLAKPAEA